MKNWQTISLVVIGLWSICACGSRPIQEPPRGYASMGMIKFAYATKMLKLIDAEPEVPDSIVRHSNILYRETAEKHLELDIYHLKDLDESRPLIIFIHGGSWKSGKRDDYRRYLVDYAAKGYVAATITYRLSQEAIFPAAYHDILCGVEWLANHAEQYKADPDRMALVGGSAGGHLAMMAAYHGSDTAQILPCPPTDGVRVKCIVNLYGPCDLRTDFAINHPSVIQFAGVSYSADTHHKFEAMSPLVYISSDDPPTLIFHGTIDDIVPIAQSDTLTQVLQSHGVYAEYHRLEGWPHTMDLGLKVNNYCQHHMDNFFKEHLW